MDFLGFGESVEAPCKELFSYPLQCFQQMFLATPAIVGTFFLGFGGFLLAIIIWAGIFALALYTFFLILKQILKGAKYFFNQTKVGQKISTVIPVGKYIQKYCWKPQDPPKKTGSATISESCANMVSKVDTKWFKGAFKHLPFTSKGHDESSPNKSPSKTSTPDRLVSRVSVLSPKLLSPKSHKD